MYFFFLNNILHINSIMHYNRLKRDQKIKQNSLIKITGVCDLSNQANHNILIVKFRVKFV